MPHISKRRISERAERLLKERLIEMIRLVGKDRKSTHSLKELFTGTESLMLAKRLGIIYMVSKGNPTLDICESLNVSSSTVIKIEKIFDRGGYKNIEKILKKLEPPLMDIIETLIAGNIPIFGRGGTKRISKILDDIK